MTADDDFDLGELARALDATTPRPDPARRAADLRLAREVFDRMHGTAAVAAPGPIVTVPRRSPLAWLAGLASPGALTATTAVVGGLFLVGTPTGRGLLERPFAVQEARDEAPTTAVEADRTAADALPSAEPEPAPVDALEEVAPPADAAPPEPDDSSAVAEAPPEQVAEEAEVALSAPAVELPPVADATAPPEGGADIALAAPPPPSAEAPEPDQTAPPGEAAVAPVGAEASAVQPPPVVAPAPEASEMAAAAPPSDEAAPATGAAALAEAAEESERTLDDLASGLVAAAPPSTENAALAPIGGAQAAVAAPGPLTVTAEAPISDVALGSSEEAGAFRAAVASGTLPEAVGVGAAAAVAPPGGIGPLATVALPAPWSPAAVLVLATLPEGAPEGARDLRLQAQWDPQAVLAWRLLGAGAVEGPGGPSLAAVWEVTPTGSAPFLGTLRLRWKPEAGGLGLLETAILAENAATPETRFAAALAGWALLSQGEPLGRWSWDEAAALAEENASSDPTRQDLAALLRRSAEGAR